MKGYFVTNENGDKEVYSRPPKRLKCNGSGVWFYNRSDSNDMQDCIYLRQWDTSNLPDELRNQSWNDEPIEIEITFNIK